MSLGYESPDLAAVAPAVGGGGKWSDADLPRLQSLVGLPFVSQPNGIAESLELFLLPEDIDAPFSWDDQKIALFRVEIGDLEQYLVVRFSSANYFAATVGWSDVRRDFVLINVLVDTSELDLPDFDALTAGRSEMFDSLTYVLAHLLGLLPSDEPVDEQRLMRLANDALTRSMPRLVETAGAILCLYMTDDGEAARRTGTANPSLARTIDNARQLLRFARYVTVETMREKRAGATALDEARLAARVLRRVGGRRTVCQFNILEFLFGLEVATPSPLNVKAWRLPGAPVAQLAQSAGLINIDLVWPFGDPTSELAAALREVRAVMTALAAALPPQFVFVISLEHLQARALPYPAKQNRIEGLESLTGLLVLEPHVVSLHQEIAYDGATCYRRYWVNRSTLKRARADDENENALPWAVSFVDECTVPALDIAEFTTNPRDTERTDIIGLPTHDTIAVRLFTEPAMQAGAAFADLLEMTLLRRHQQPHVRSEETLLGLGILHMARWFADEKRSRAPARMRAAHALIENYDAEQRRMIYELADAVFGGRDAPAANATTSTESTEEDE